MLKGGSSKDHCLEWQLAKHIDDAVHLLRLVETEVSRCALPARYAYTVNDGNFKLTLQSDSESLTSNQK